MHNISDVREGVGHCTKWQDFAQTVSTKHFITKQDVKNIWRSVSDRLIKRHDNDAMSVSIFVREIQEPFNNPVLIYKQQGIILEFPTLAKKIICTSSANRISDGNLYFAIKFFALIVPTVLMLTIQVDHLCCSKQVWPRYTYDRVIIILIIIIIIIIAYNCLYSEINTP